MATVAPEQPQQRYVMTSLMRYILFAIALLIVIGVFAWFFFFRDTGQKVAAPSGNSTIANQPSNSGSQSTPKKDTTKSSGPSDHGSSQSGSAAPSTNKSSTSQSGSRAASNGSDGEVSPSDSSASSSQLADTGPGQVIAVFAVATVAGTLFRSYQLRRQN